jgi:hypothetical protein
LACLKSKPGQREVNTSNHRSHGNHPQPSRPKSARPTLGQERGAEAYERSQRGRRSEYTTKPPITEIATNKLILNFYPSKAKDNPVELLDITNTDFFTTV